MIGLSYPGHSLIFTASLKPRHLKAIVPGAVPRLIRICRDGRIRPRSGPSAA